MPSAIRMAHAPETEKTTIKAMLLKTVEAVRKVCPDLPMVMVADGARDNWKFLDSDAFPDSPQVLDFLSRHPALERRYRERIRRPHGRANSKYEEFCSALRYHKYGVGKVISFLRNLLDHYPSNKTVTRELAFLRETECA